MATVGSAIVCDRLRSFAIIWKPALSGLMFCDISDHLPIFTLLLDQSKNLNETSWLSFRDKSANNFTNRLANVNWDELMNIKILIVLIGVSLINTQPFIITVFLLKK